MKKLIMIVGGAAVLAAILAVGFNLQRDRIGEFAYKRATPNAMNKDVIAELDDGLHLFLCGTGSPMPDPSRAGPCQAIIAGKKMYIVDVGEGASRSFSPNGIRLDYAEAILLTHFHSDHINGLGDLMIQRWANTGADKPMKVIGPRGTNEIVTLINQFLSHDRDYRILHHGDLMPMSGYGGITSEFDIMPGEQKEILTEGDLSITAFAVDHGGIHPAVGYRFDYKDRSIVISGDTSKSDILETASDGADILVHEALNPEMIDVMTEGFNASGRSRLGTIFQEIKPIHTTTEDAGASASIAGVDLLVLSHVIPPAPSRLLDAYFARDAKQQFSGDVVVGRDGMVFQLPAQSDKIIRD
ncbi:MAG TPA: MBL fold metallo-hydrolase [Hyphomonas sp.]|nr:MBL fold metallo-hydrolase [Hyphomonas sp.]HRK66012.1 MBL fold metallo-hydrolase [Hyphomonas sp.]